MFSSRFPRRASHLLLGAGLAAGLSLPAAAALAAPPGPGNVVTPTTSPPTTCPPILGSCDFTSATTAPPCDAEVETCETTTSTTKPTGSTSTTKPAVDDGGDPYDPPVRATPAFTG